jgi:hypothetical protein
LVVLSEYAPPQPQFLECGGKGSATPLSAARVRRKSGVAAALCHRSPNLCRPCAELRDCITDENHPESRSATARIRSHSGGKG